MVGQWLASGLPMVGLWLAFGWSMVEQWLANGEGVVVWSGVGGEGGEWEGACPGGDGVVVVGTGGGSRLVDGWVGERHPLPIRAKKSVVFLTMYHQLLGSLS